MRLLITGATGMLGQDVCDAARSAGHEPVALAHDELDVRNEAAVDAAVHAARPQVIVNCAAWTNVDGAETAEAAAEAVNGAGAGNVARAAFRHGAWIVHISSDYVFDGGKREPYVESDPVGPLSAYGRSKLAGELAVAREAPERHTIVRSSWLFGTGGPCFPATILRLAAERDQITIVDDQRGCPTFTPHLSRALLEVADASMSGVLHVAGAGDCTWFQFAQEIVVRAGLECDVLPGTTAALGRPAPRPAYSVLRSEREDTPVLADWREGLSEYLAAGVRSA